MAMEPHKLDDVFSDVENVEAAFMASESVKDAFARAKAKFVEVQRDSEANPGKCGESPAQSARVEFFDTLNDSPQE